MDTHPQVLKLSKIPQYPQRSPEWFSQRYSKLTSSDVDTVLGLNKYQKPIDVLFKKCGIAGEFNGNEATRHGQHYESEAISHYCKMYNKQTLSFGLLPHPQIEWLGGSPDDITLDGIVIEVKCPLYRKIEMGKIPDHYISQVKMNMEITGLDTAVFIEYVPGSITPDGVHVLNIVHIERDPDWFPSVFPILESFWKEVLHYRTNGIETHTLYNKMVEKTRKKNEIIIHKNKFVADSDTEDSLDDTDKLLSKFSFRDDRE